MQIKPISSWQNGQEKLGTEFNLRLIGDNLETSATFYYSISSVEVSHTETIAITPEVAAWDETVKTLEGTETIVSHEAIPAVTAEVKVVDSYAQLLVDGNLTIDGTDYQTWDADPSANTWAYNWSLAKLNLVAVV